MLIYFIKMRKNVVNKAATRWLLFCLILFSIFGCVSRKKIDENISNLNHPDRQIRLQAGNNLLGIGRPCIGPLIEAVKTGDDSIKYIGIQILGKLRARQSNEMLKQFIKEDNYLLRIKSTEALARIQDKINIPFFIKLLSDSSYLVRAYAVEGLGLLRNKKTYLNLTEMLSDSIALVRRNAVVALDNFQDDERTKKYLTSSLEDKDANVRYVVIQSLRNIGTKDLYSLFIKSLRDKNKWVRMEAIHAVHKFKIKDAKPNLLDIVAEGEEDELKAAQRTLKVLTGNWYEREESNQSR